MNIIELSGKQKAYTFAKISKQAYDDKPTYYGYQSRKITVDGSVVFILFNEHDIVIACRGTELNDIRDIKTDASTRLVPSVTGTGRGHNGFETAVGEVWVLIQSFLKHINSGQNIWFTGHSLGAAMSHIMSVLYKQKNPDANVMLYTFGSPRVGDEKNTALGSVEHHRYVHSSDIVPRIPIPLPFRGYRHYGTLHYLNKDGVEIYANWAIVVKDRIKCFFSNPVGLIENHFIDQYVTFLGMNE